MADPALEARLDLLIALVGLQFVAWGLTWAGMGELVVPVVGLLAVIAVLYFAVAVLGGGPTDDTAPPEPEA